MCEKGDNAAIVSMLTSSYPLKMTPHGEFYQAEFYHTAIDKARTKTCI